MMHVEHFGMHHNLEMSAGNLDIQSNQDMHEEGWDNICSQEI